MSASDWSIDPVCLIQHLLHSHPFSRSNRLASGFQIALDHTKYLIPFPLYFNLQLHHKVWSGVIVKPSHCCTGVRMYDMLSISVNNDNFLCCCGVIWSKIKLSRCALSSLVTLPCFTVIEYVCGGKGIASALCLLIHLQVLFSSRKNSA